MSATTLARGAVARVTVAPTLGARTPAARTPAARTPAARTPAARTPLRGAFRTALVVGAIAGVSLTHAARAGAQTGGSTGSGVTGGGTGASDASRVASTPGGAQRSRITTGFVYEHVSFSGGGILESGLGGVDSSRVLSGNELGVPVQFSTVIGGRWLLDAGTSFTTGKRTIGGNVDGETLSGIGDVRLRVTRRFDRYGLRVTAGANIPTGITDLTAPQTATLSVLGSPAIGLTQPAVGFGGGATLGIVKSFAAASRQWGAAFGASMEWRGAYEPYAAIAAGSALDSYDPGEVVRLSAGASRLFGESKGLVTASLDLFGKDQVSPKGVTNPTSVQIGPTVAIDAQWLPATQRVKSAVLFAGLRVRSALKRDGTELANSGNVIFEAGGRGARAMSPTLDLVGELSARVLTAVEIDNRLATAASTSVAPALGFSMHRATWTAQPMVTARLGNVDTGLASGGFSVLGARLTLERRF